MWTLSGSSDNRAHSHTESLSLHVAHSFPPQPRGNKASAALDSWCLIGTLHWTKYQSDVQGQQWVMGQRKLEDVLRKPHVSAPPWVWTCKAIEHGGVATAPGNALERKNPVWCREACTVDWAGQGRAGMSAPWAAAPEPQEAEPPQVTLHPHCWGMWRKKPLRGCIAPTIQAAVFSWLFAVTKCCGKGKIRKASQLWCPKKRQLITNENKTWCSVYLFTCSSSYLQW